MILRSDIECKQTIRNQRMEKSVCVETHLFRPFSNGQSGASTRITQSLTFSQERRSDEKPTGMFFKCFETYYAHYIIHQCIDYKRKRASLLFDGPQMKPTGSSLSLVDDVIKELSQESPIRIPALFSRLVTTLRPLTYRQLSEIFAKTVDNTRAK